MPELPEVETIVNDLKLKITNKKIAAVDVRLFKIIKSSKADFRQILVNNFFTDIFRRGKFLVFKLAKGKKYLLIHLRMTGQLIYRQKHQIIAGGHSLTRANLKKLPNKHSHVIISFTKGAELFFNDARQFGIMEIVKAENLTKRFSHLGIEPLSKKFTLAVLQKLLQHKTNNIKAFLLNQNYVVGIGNIYADEILFAAQILPSRKSAGLKATEIQKIFRAIKIILKKAIEYRGTTFNDYVDAYGRQGNFIKKLKVYQREKKNCLRCKKGVIQKTRLAGRGTRFCKICQK
ncbi:MAG: DNA-formamidopyrimidine glycosylase [Candidatus Kerfeldbacteria bacterium RIFOXYC2_FULL_38_9]|uniref:DNA-formamidopyrimidine glycosylase n=1 Tax=Candidatus Kerfeldbacteria bacterium RIFOXYB2_FULL_38_14 TaxID=1798547 RepID=A0A1G2BGG1_9BACT|nr:MAG: DNA-formamidopyrimidine glycosylase [Candidatus Kerfeldbacteria bacterium RIFOXYB2_FULL_38_14]OGY89724.1 MAG: DNA-formamidopyrimidine glycosylase [Candidatus Kerfeldbacteria bacterium RIFOXYC2_FULL_38_9]